MQIVRALSRAGGRGRVLDVFQEALHLLPLDCIQYAPLRYEHTYARVHTQVCTSAAHLRSDRPLLHPPLRGGGTYQGKIKCKHLLPPEFDQNSVGEELGEQVENFEESIRKAGFELAKGSHSSRHCLKKKGNEGGEAIENLESTQQWLFVRLTRPSLETIPREPYTTSPSSSSLHRDQASERQSACPGVSLCIRHMHNFFFLLPLLLFPSLFFFFIIVHLGQPFRRQFRLFFKDVHHFSGRVKSHSTTSYPSLSLRGWKADLNFLIEESALFENSLVSLSTDFFGFFLFLFPFSRRPEYLFHGDIDFSPVIRYNYLFRRFEKRFLS